MSGVYMFDYDEIAATALRLLTRFGRTQTLQRKSGGTFDPVTGVETGASLSELTCIGLEKTISNSLIDGVNIKFGDRLFILDNSQIPQQGDKLKVGSEYWPVINVIEKKPADTTLVYFVQIRK